MGGGNSVSFVFNFASFLFVNYESLTETEKHLEPHFSNNNNNNNKKSNDGKMNISLECTFFFIRTRSLSHL